MLCVVEETARNDALNAALCRCTLQPGSSMCTCYRLLYLRAYMVLNSLVFFVYCFSCCLLLVMYSFGTYGMKRFFFYSGTKICSAISPGACHLSFYFWTTFSRTKICSAISPDAYHLSCYLWNTLSGTKIFSAISPGAHY